MKCTNLKPGSTKSQGIPSALIPLLLTSIVIGSAIALRVAKTSRRIWSLLISAIGAGLVATWLMQSVLGVLNGTFINNASVISLGVLAIAALTNCLDFRLPAFRSFQCQGINSETMGRRRIMATNGCPKHCIAVKFIL